MNKRKKKIIIRSFHVYNPYKFEIRINTLFKDKENPAHGNFRFKDDEGQIKASA